MERENSKKGFTIVELIVVIGLLIIIAGIFSLNMIMTTQKQREEDNKNIVAQIISAANTYVSINPDEVKNLYEGYGYVDIPVGDLKEAGLLTEELIDKESGKKIPDDDKVRVKLDITDTIEFTYPAEGELNGYKFTADNLNVAYDEFATVESWCKINDTDPISSNVYGGLSNNANYLTNKSRMYAVDKNGQIYKDDLNKYFSDFKLSVESCDVNPSKVGTYSITYKYTDPDTNEEKTFKRVVYIDSKSKDVISFAVEINGGTPIVRGTRPEVIPIRIIETYRDGTKTIDTYIGKLKPSLNPEYDYEIADFKTDNVITKDATVSRTKQNSDGSLPPTEKSKYEVISDVYDVTYDIGYTLNKRESGFPDRVKKYNEDVNMLKTKKPVKFQYDYSEWSATPSNKYNSYGGDFVNPTRRGYTFQNWQYVPGTCYTTYDSPDATRTKTYTIKETIVYNNTLMNNLCNHTIKALWKPNEYTVYFYENASGVTLNTTSKKVTYDSTYGTLPTPTKTGYTFLGWFTAPSGGTQVTASTEVDIIDNQNLYAHWKANNYTVTFSGGSVSPSSKTVTYDSAYGVLPTPYRSSSSSSSSAGAYCTRYCTTYYSFSGYTLNGSSVTSSTIVKTPSNHTLQSNFSSSSSCSTSCNYPPPPAPSNVDTSKDSSSDDVVASNSATHYAPTTCSISCYNPCGHPAAAADMCGNEWAKANQQGASKEELEEIHQQALGLRNDAFGDVTYDDRTGKTYDSSGNLVTCITGICKP